MYPFGLAPREDGTGTTPEGLQRILHARYARPGIIDGCALTLSSSAMSVAVGAGAVAVLRASGLMVEVPVAPASVMLAAAPASGSRVDLLVVDAATGDVTVAAAAGAGKQEIGRITVPAGAVTASQCTVSFDRAFAMMRGGSQGVLATWVDPTARSVAVVTGTNKRTMCTFRIPAQSTDRYIEVYVEQSVYAASEGTVQYELLRDTQLMETMELKYDSIWAPRHHHFRTWLYAGTAHTLTVTQMKGRLGPDPLHLGGGTDKRSPSKVQVIDRGAAA